MAREQVNMTTGATPRAGIAGNENATADAITFDLFVGNQGEGAMRVTLDYTNFSSFFIPPHAHREAVNLASGDVIVLDSLEIMQIVAIQDAGADAYTFGATGQKTHITAASTANDYLVTGVGIRANP